MQRGRFLGLRPRLVILVLVALVPAIILILYEFTELRDREMAIARSEVVRQSRRMASYLEQEVEGTRDHLMAVTRIPPTAFRGRSDRPAANGAPIHDALLELLLKRHPAFVAVAIADADGRVVRSAEPSAQAMDVSARPWFKAARRSRKYTVGEYETWTPGNRPVLALAFPASGGAGLYVGLHGGSGDVRQVAFAMLDTERAGPALGNSALPDHFAVTVFDRRGTILSRHPNPTKWRGTSVAGFPVVADLLANPRERVEEMQDLDSRRVWAFSPVHVQGETVAFVAAGIPVNVAYAGAHDTLRRSILLLSLMTCLVAALAWYIGERIVLPRLRGLVRAAERVAAGDRGVRTGLQHHNDEIGLLAGAFDHMASSLDERDAELRRTEEALRRSEAHYRLLFDMTPLAAGVYDTETLRFLTVNEMAVEFYGYTREEFMELRITDLVAPEDVPEARRWIAENAKEPMHAQVWNHRRKDGMTMQVEAVSHGLEVNGRPARLAMVIDVTERIRSTEALRASRDQLRDLANRLQSAREEERGRIARGIHDELGQALTGLKMDLSWLRARAEKMDGSSEAGAVHARIARMIDLTDETVQTVRRIATELRPSVLDALGLVPALEWQSRDFTSRFGINCSFTSRIEELLLGPECATAVFRIFQETLTNVARHAHATSVKARLDCPGDHICLTIDDNGVGIAPEALEGSRSLGLLGLRERAQVIGADLAISGRPGEGTKVVLTFPTGPRGCLLAAAPCILRGDRGETYECSAYERDGAVAFECGAEKAGR